MGRPVIGWLSFAEFILELVVFKALESDQPLKSSNWRSIFYISNLYKIAELR
jgi:hypothetical protein